MKFDTTSAPAAASSAVAARLHGMGFWLKLIAGMGGSAFAFASMLALLVVAGASNAGDDADKAEVHEAAATLARTSH